MASPGADAPNTLSPAEQASGYSLLFNGKDLEGWTAWRGGSIRSWKVDSAADGTFLVNSQGDRHNLVTTGKDYRDFDLKLEWKTPRRGTSGIYIRYLEVREWGGASGPEAEICSPQAPSCHGAIHMAGSSYGLFPPDSGRMDWAWPDSQWNQFRIVAFGKRIAHYGNGRKLLEYEMHSPAWEKAYSESLYRDYPLFRDVHPGAIYFEHHGETGMAFRNIRIKVLGGRQDPWTQGSPYRNLRGGLIDSLELVDNLFATPTSISVLPPIPRHATWTMRRGRIQSHDFTFLISDVGGRILSPRVVGAAIPSTINHGRNSNHQPE